MNYSHLKGWEIYKKFDSLGLTAQAILILKGLSKNPTHSRSKSSLCLLLRKILAAPFTSALINLPLEDLYKPRLILLPLNVPA